MQALEKLTLAYLALQERAEKLQADKDAMFFENQTLQAKYKKAKEKNAFLQADRNKWFDAYEHLYKSNEALTIEQADEMRNLKECIDELEGQCVELQAKLDALQPAPIHKINDTKKAPICDKYSEGIGAEGYEAEKHVCRAGFKDSETPNDTDKKPQLYHTIYDNPA
jgi:predicted nuclease with TOPRIM domain